MISRAQRSGAALLCLLLAIVHTWPLALNLAHLSRNDNGDAQLNEWILAWVAHQLPRDPIHLFEANIFYPAHDAHRARCHGRTARVDRRVTGPCL